MHVLLEAHILGSPQHRGISNSIRHLVPGLRQQGMTVTVMHNGPSPLFDELGVYEPNQGSATTAPIDLVHTFTQEMPRHKNVPWVLTVYDLIIEHYPEVLQQVFPRLQPAMVPHMQRYMRAATRRADRLIAISNNTKRDVVKLYDISPDMIDVVHLAAAATFQPVPEEQKIQFRQKNNLTGPCFLFIGSRWTYKNIGTLLQAFGIYLKERRDDSMLVVIGSSATWSTAEQKLIDHYQLHKNIITIPDVSDEQLNHWYNIADALVYPSLYEGFGLPPLEAMCCGCPVIASKAGSIPEVVGTAALQFDPKDPEELAELLKKIVYDVPLREKCKNESIEQGKKFSWAHTALQTAAVYEKVLASR